MNYDASLADLDALAARGMRLDPAPFERLLQKLDNPHHAYRTILVGGTNGKGSTAAMIASMLTRVGLRVGLYTSPHLVDVRERIRVDRVFISSQELSEYLLAIRQVEDGGATYFEYLTAAAFLHFHAWRIDLAVLEVGMGGRLDATNVVSPVLSIICNVTLEHTEYLGRRLQDIAGEKAGIIRPGGLCLTAARQEAVKKMLRAYCRGIGATLHEMGRDFSVRTFPDGSFAYRGHSLSLRNLRTTLPGKHQIRNAALAIAAVESLALRGFPIDDHAIRVGIASVNWPGRLETVAKRPLLVLDGAHNPAAVAVLCDALKGSFTWRKLIVIFGVLKDKNYPAMMKRLGALADLLILTAPTTDRAVSPDNLLVIARQYAHAVEVMPEPEQALKKARAIADSDDLICVTGSLYLVGEIKGHLASPVHGSGSRK